MLLTSAGEWQLAYHIVGNLDQVVLPAVGTAERRDELWRHTCCELFCRIDGAAAYQEFNFSPSNSWAAYDFDAYRTGQRDSVLLTAPMMRLSNEVGVRPLERVLRLEIEMRVRPAMQRQQIGCATVIELTDGSLSYWALAHPLDRPDFHHPASFAKHLIPDEVLP